MLSIVRQNRYESELKRCYCTRIDCNFSCDVAVFCDSIADGIMKDSFMRDVDIAFIEQDTISRVLRGARGDWCQTFSDQAKEMDGHMSFIKSSVFRASVVMQFIFNCTIGVFRSCRNQIHHITTPNGDFVHAVITNPRFNFARLLRSSLRILNYEIQRIGFTRECIHEFVQFLDLQLAQVGLTNQNLIQKVVVEKRTDLKQASKRHNFYWKTYEVWHAKNRRYLLTTERLMACNLYKLVRMRDMHAAVLANWSDFSVLPDNLHPKNFENLFIKI